MSDDKKRVNIEDLPVPLRELDKEEQENVTGGTGAYNPTTVPTPGAINPAKNPSSIPQNPDAFNKGPQNPKFNP